MRRYLLDHASEYIDAHRHFATKRGRMTDQERDEIDHVPLLLHVHVSPQLSHTPSQEMSICMKECCEKIDRLKQDMSKLSFPFLHTSSSHLF
jgi:hypothetical protein